MLREPVVAGRFYESDPVELKSQIDSCYKHQLGAADSKITCSGRLAGFIAPHAGFVFSGPVASHAYSRLALEKPFPETIILLGPKHTHYGAEFSISAARTWKTPLGNVELDRDLCEKLLAGVDLLQSDNEAHMFEHSLEVQLPFLQHFAPQLPRIVPIALNYTSLENINQLASGIRHVINAEKNKKVLFIASSDFSHDTPREEAYRLDGQVIARILKLDAQGFYDLVIGEDRSVCGVIPITTLLMILVGTKLQAKLLKYATSMDIMRHDRGVGYGAIIFEEVP